MRWRRWESERASRFVADADRGRADDIEFRVASALLGRRALVGGEMEGRIGAGVEVSAIAAAAMTAPPTAQSETLIPR